MCFGGASAAEKSISQDQQQMMTTLQNNYNTQFAGQSAILNNLNTSASSIFNAGIGQKGFSPAEEAAMRTQASEGTAAGYKMARQATGEAVATLGGGNDFLPSGTAVGINNANAVKFAQQNSENQLGITEANYAQGRQNYLSAAGILGNVASAENPLGYAGAANSAGAQAFNDQSQITQENNAGWQTVAGVLGGAATGFLSGYGSSLGKKSGG